LEIFEHFDTDFSGEIDVPEFVDGLKRLGIYLTNAENLALLQRFSIQVCMHLLRLTSAAVARDKTIYE